MESLTEHKDAQARPIYVPEDHPWLDISDSSIDESILYSLDELRFA